MHQQPLLEEGNETEEANRTQNAQEEIKQKEQEYGIYLSYFPLLHANVNTCKYTNVIMLMKLLHIFISTHFNRCSTF